MRRCYPIKAPPIAHQTIDGEVVIVNLLNGSYYSLRGSGAALWRLLEQRAPGEALVTELGRQFVGAPAEIAAGVQNLLDELEREGIVAAVEVSDATPFADGSPPTGEPVPFAAPVLEKFTDMQELLLLDPIHEVADVGWPHPKTEAA